MKTSKLTAEQRYERRMDIMEKRSDALAAWRHRGVTTLQYRTTRKVFGKRGKVSHDYGPYPHSSERQRARYARQVAAGQLRIVGVEGPTASEMRAAAKFMTASGSKDFLTNGNGNRRFKAAVEALGGDNV